VRAKAADGGARRTRARSICEPKPIQAIYAAPQAWSAPPSWPRIASGEIEGATDLHEIVQAVIRAALADEALARGLKCRISDMQGRLDRLEDRTAKRRQIVKDVMVELDLKKLNAPDFTASIREGIPSLMVLNEDAVPSIYWQPSEPRLNRQKLPTNSNRARKSPALRSRTRNRVFGEAVLDPVQEDPTQQPAAPSWRRRCTPPFFKIAPIDQELVDARV
jgi:hypothetical protein